MNSIAKTLQDDVKDLNAIAVRSIPDTPKRIVPESWVAARCRFENR